MTLEQLKANQETFDRWLERDPSLVVAAFFALYVAITAFSLPGAAILTLAAGAFLGLWLGLIEASFASSIGAMLAFLASRFLLRDFAQRRFGRRLEAINRGVEKDGAFYLFSLRLVPVFPFLAIADSAAQGFVKVLTVPGKDKILGVTIVGDHAGELLAEFVLAMRHGLGLNKILGTIHPYPTVAEANKCVAGEWKKAHASDRLVRLSAKYH